MSGMLSTLNFITWDVDPAVFSFSEIPRWYGVCWATGLLLSYYLISYIYKSENRSQHNIDHLSMVIVAGTMLGARLGHVLFYNPVYYWHHPEEILLPIRLHPFEFVGFEGLASHGAAFGILIAIYFVARSAKERYLFILDRLAIIAALSGAFIRTGNLLNSEIVGTQTDVPWAFIFVQVDNVPRHPAQLYEAIFCFGLFLVLIVLWKTSRKSLPEGLLSGLFLSTLFLQRFINEFFKMDQEAFEEGLWLNMGQLLSIPLILLGVVLLWRARKNNSAAKTQ